MSWEGPWGVRGGGPPVPAEGRRRKKGRKNNCSSMTWKTHNGSSCAPGKAPCSPQGPAARASCTSARRHVAPEQDAPHAAARASASPPLPGSWAPAASSQSSERELAHLPQRLLAVHSGLS
uniref:Uncharacterized protein n=1 Tax=Pipistrellus kuhlii TaxID=59472 RepID=A0A7J7ZJT4_PIPKU|nr:hypothetical protein mPipKuh1_009518 [Pipistrellus kuhlii]